jgi:hypothetical protein
MVLWIARIVRQPFMRGNRDFLVEGTSAPVQKNVAMFDNLGAQSGDELAAQVRISWHIP